MSATAAELAGKLRRAGQRMETVPRAGIMQSCLAAKGIMLAEAAASNATSLSGVGRKGARIGVGFDVKGGVNATGIVSYRGPAHLANNPRRGGYEIRPKKRRGKKALSTPDGPRASATGGATRGKKFFERAEPKVAAQTSAIFRQEVRRQLVSVFGP